MEYRNIISNLKLGNIESDNEIIELYQELMNVISGKTLTREAAAHLQKDYDDWEHQQIINSLYNVRAYGIDPLTIGTTFAVSCMSSYFAYQDITEGPRKNLEEELYKIDVQERESYNSLQTRLLNSSWRLMRQYKLPDGYRIVQESVNDLYRAVNDKDNKKRLNMLRALEDEFRIYPPYWVYRARSAEKAGNIQEVSKCYDEFDKVWRPILRNDPYKLEAEKFRVQEAMKSGKNSEALEHIAAVRENTPRSDWADNLFAGVAYFVLGDKQKGMNCVELNINFGAEKEISGAVLEQMHSGKINLATLPEELRKLVGLSALRMDTIEALANDGDLEAQLTLGKIYSDGGITFTLEKIYAAGEISSKDYAIALSLYEMAALRKPGEKIKADKVSVEIPKNEGSPIFMFGEKKFTAGGIVPKDYAEAVKWYTMAANKNDETAIFSLAGLYRQGGPNLESDYKTAAEWGKKLADKGNEAAILGIASLYLYGGPNLSQDSREAVNWYEKAAYNGSKTAQNALAEIYFYGGNNISQSYYTSYIWCCVAEMIEEHFMNGTDTALVTGAIIGGIGAVIGAPLLPLVAIGAIASGWLGGSAGEYTIKEQIEEAGIFNLAKLSDAEMSSAKIEAGKIMSEIERIIKQRQQ